MAARQQGVIACPDLLGGKEEPIEQTPASPVAPWAFGKGQCIRKNGGGQAAVSLVHPLGSQPLWPEEPGPWILLKNVGGPRYESYQGGLLHQLLPCTLQSLPECSSPAAQPHVLDDLPKCHLRSALLGGEKAQIFQNPTH